MKKGGNVTKGRIFLVLASIIVLLLAYMVWAEDISVTTASPHPQNNSQWHDFVTFNISTVPGDSIRNVTFRIQALSGDEDAPNGFIFNYTIFNGTNNSNEDFKVRFNSRDLFVDGFEVCGGGCNISVILYNSTYSGATGSRTVEINGVGGEGNAGVFFVNDRPQAVNITVNESLSDFQNFSNTADIEIVAHVNDSFSQTDAGSGISIVLFRVWNSTSSQNVSASTTHTYSSGGSNIHKNLSSWNATIDADTLKLNNGTRYNISVLVNDSVRCVAEGGANQCFGNLNDTTYITIGIGLTQTAVSAADDNTLSITTENPTPKNDSAWHDVITFNISTESASVENVTFRIQDTGGPNSGKFTLNLTVFNSTNNSNKDFHFRFNSRTYPVGFTTLTDGAYNVTVEIYNSTYDGTNGVGTREIMGGPGQGNDGFKVHNARPKTNNLSILGSAADFQNFSSDDLGNGIRFESHVTDTYHSQDTQDGISGVRFRVWNSTNSYNFTGSTNHSLQGTLHKNTSAWNATLDLSSTELTDGNYNVSVEVNDTSVCEQLDGELECLPNLNSTTFLTIGLDDNEPTVVINTPTDSANFTKSSSNQTFNVTVKDFHDVTFVKFSIDNGSGTPFNISAVNNSGQWIAEYNVSTLGESSDLLITVLVNDSFGNQNNSETVSIITDYTAPNVSGITPTQDSNFTVTSYNQSFNVTIKEANAVLTMVFQFNNATGNDFNVTPVNYSGTWEALYNVSRLVEGYHTVTYFAKDYAGNVQNNLTRRFTVDNTAPTVNFTEPSTDTNFTITSYNQSFNITVKENNYAKKVVFSFNNATGTPFNATPTNFSGIWQVLYNVSNLAEGFHLLTILANDSAGNQNVTETQTFTVDNSKPLVNFTNTNYQEVTLSTFNITFNVSIKDVTIQAVVFSFENVTGTAFNITATNSSGYWAVEYNVSSLAAGNNTITVLANDTHGNYNRTTVLAFNLTRVVAAGAPVVTMVTKDDRNYTVTSSNQSFNATIAELNISIVRFSFDNASGTPFNVTPTNNSGHWSASYNVSVLPEGRHLMTVLANDTDKNTDNTKSIVFTLDSTAPNVTVLDETKTSQDKNFTISSFNQTFNVSIKDLLMGSMSNVIFSFDNASGTGFNITAVKEFTTSNSSWVVEYNVSVLAEGTNVIRIFANDTIGNLNATQTIEFTLDNTAPTVNWTTNNNSNFSKTSFNQTFNVSIKEANFVRSVQFSFDNGSGTGFNVTATNGSGYWSAIYNVSALVEGNITITVIANDSVGNLNSSQQIRLTTDYTLFPLTNVTSSGITATAATITWNTTETANATVDYGTTLALGTTTSSTTRTRQHTVALASLTSNSGYFFNVTSCDYAGNCNSTNGTSFTTLEAAGSTNTGSPGGGSGGSTGSDSAGTATAGKISTSEPTTTTTPTEVVAEVKQEFTEISTEEIATVNVAASSPSIGVNSVSFSVSSPVKDAWVNVAEIVQLPPEVKEFAGKTYKNLEISHSESITNDNLVTPKIDFKVTKAWLSENELGADAVALHRFVDAEWAELATTLASSDDEFAHYSAETPGFSFFVIGEKSRDKAITGAAVTVPVEEVSKQPSIWSKIDLAKVGMTALLILLAGFLLMIGIGVYNRIHGYMESKREDKPEEPSREKITKEKPSPPMVPFSKEILEKKEPEHSEQLNLIEDDPVIMEERHEEEKSTIVNKDPSEYDEMLKRVENEISSLSNTEISKSKIKE